MKQPTLPGLDVASSFALTHPPTPDSWGRFDPAPSTQRDLFACRCDDLAPAGELFVRFVPCPVHDDAIAAATGRALRTTDTPDQEPDHD